MSKEGRKIYEVFFRNLTPEAQEKLCEIFQTTEIDENWDTFPLCTLEREDGEGE